MTVTKKKSKNPHMDPEMREYVVQLWFDGISEHVIERLVRKRLAERRAAAKKDQKSA